MSEYYKKPDGSIYAINYEEEHTEEKNTTDNIYTPIDDSDEYIFKDIQDENDSNELASTEKSKLDKYKCFKIATKQIFQIFTAAALLVAAMIGFAVAVNFVNKDSNIQDLKSYDSLIWPVVMQNPEPFDEKSPPRSQYDDKSICVGCSFSTQKR